MAALESSLQAAEEARDAKQRATTEAAAVHASDLRSSPVRNRCVPIPCKRKREYKSHFQYCLALAELLGGFH